MALIDDFLVEMFHFNVCLSVVFTWYIAQRFLLLNQSTLTLRDVQALTALPPNEFRVLATRWRCTQRGELLRLFSPHLKFNDFFVFQLYFFVFWWVFFDLRLSTFVWKILFMLHSNNSPFNSLRNKKCNHQKHHLLWNDHYPRSCISNVSAMTNHYFVSKHTWMNTLRYFAQSI